MQSLREEKGGFLKPCLQTDLDDCFSFTSSSLEGGKKGSSGQLHVGREMLFPREKAKVITRERNLV